MRTIKLLLVSPNAIDGTSYYRAYGIAGHLMRNHPVEIIPMEYGDVTRQWPVIDQCDVALLQRPHAAHYLETLRYIQQMGKPVIVDFDDDLFNILPINPAYLAFKDQRTKDILKSVLSEADMVFVSTQKLKEVYGTLNNNIHVIRNAYNAKNFKYAKERGIERSKLNVWRGGNGHIHDVEKYKKAILHFVNDRKDYHWAFLGYYPPILPEENENIRALHFSDVIFYHRQIWNLKPRVLYVPLELNTFNLCKSNVSYIEGTMAGAVCIVPDWQEWRCPGTLLYKDEDEFRDLMKLALRNDFDVNAMNKKAWNYINNEQSLDVWNKKRFKLIKELV